MAVKASAPVNSRHYNIISTSSSLCDWRPNADPVGFRSGDARPHEGLAAIGVLHHACTRYPLGASIILVSRRMIKLIMSIARPRRFVGNVSNTLRPKPFPSELVKFWLLVFYSTSCRTGHKLLFNTSWISVVCPVSLQC